MPEQPERRRQLNTDALIVICGTVITVALITAAATVAVLAK